MRPNADELERAVAVLLSRGRAASAAELIEREAPSGGRTWAGADRLATLLLQLGEPSRARRAWIEADAPPRGALRAARVALTFLVEGEMEAARRGYREAIAAEPSLFEAQYGLAALEFDAGRAAEALAAAGQALALATGPPARSAARSFVEMAAPHAGRGPSPAN